MKKNSTESNGEVQQQVIGLDLSDEASTYVVIACDTGEIVEEGSVYTTRAAMAKRFGSRPAARVVIEAGSQSAWVSRLLTDLGHEVIVANPRQVALIARSKHKSDRLDAITLARLGRIDPALLHPIKHRGKDAQLDLAMLRSRDFLVTERTRYVNHVRGVVKTFGESIPNCSTEAFPARAEGVLAEDLRELVAPCLENIATLTAQIKVLDDKVKRLADQKYSEALALKQIKGVGPIISLAFVLTIEEPERFSVSRDVPAYLGLTPGLRQSGASNPQLHITKAGDAFLRKLLVQGAQYILGPFGEDCDLRRWGLKLCGQPEKGKNKVSQRAKKRAVTAVARKLAVLLHTLWRRGDPYEPLRYRQEVIAATG